MTNFDKIKESYSYERFKEGWSLCDHIQEQRGILCSKIDCKACHRWLQKQYEEPVLDEVERRYIFNVIEPFEDEIDCIIKYSYHGSNAEEYISIEFKNGESIDFPNFKKGTMYKGMEPEKRYKISKLKL